LCILNYHFRSLIYFWIKFNIWLNF
jgi:hypothetical protein